MSRRPAAARAAFLPAAADNAGRLHSAAAPHAARLLSAAAIGLLAAAVPLFSSPVRAQDEKQVILEHADSLVGTVIDGQQARELIGHVRLRQGRTVVDCNRAVQRLVSGLITMEGDVEVRDDSMRMAGVSGTYDPATRTAEAFERVQLDDRTTELRSAYGRYNAGTAKAFFRGSVRVEDTASVLTCDSLDYFRKAERSIGMGHVAVTGTRDNVTITGGRFEHDRAGNAGRMTLAPVMTQIDTAGRAPGAPPDTLVVTSVSMARDTLGRLTALGNVVITRGTLAAEAGTADFLVRQDSIILRESPVIWYGDSRTGPAGNQVSGDSVFLKLHNRKLDRAYVRGRAVAVSQADSAFPERFNQMTGREIVLRFSDGRIDRIDVNTTATSLYFLFDGRKGNGANKTTGDHVAVTFRDGKIDRIAAVTAVEGEYIPERLIRGHEKSYNLEGFNYRPPVRRVAPLPELR